MEISGIERAFSPQIVRRQRKKGKNIEKMFDLLPGYVFAYSTRPAKGLSQLKVEGVIRVLGFPENDYCLCNEDRFFALRLLEKDGFIDVLNVLRIGDNVKITDNLFFGNRRKSCSV